MDSVLLTAGMTYELLICRAYKCDNTKKGAHSSNLTNLLEIEGGRNLSFLPSAAKKLDNVKKYLGKAIEAFRKRKLTDDERIKLTTINATLHLAPSAGQLISLINEAEVITRRFK